MIESHFIELAAKEKLHLKRFCGDPAGPVIFCLHGSYDSGRTFYNKEGSRGLAPFLAAQGFDVYIADLRGHGESTPAVSAQSRFGQSEIIQEDLPAFEKKINELRPHAPRFWLAHSWGGVLLLSYLARHPEAAENLRGLVFMGVKRRIVLAPRWQRLKLFLLWYQLAPLLIRFYGYFPAPKLKLGSQNDSRKFSLQSMQWNRSRSLWRDSDDAFDYAGQIKKVRLPPILNVCGQNDLIAGHPKDCALFLQEVGAQKVDHLLLSKAQGFQHDYNHVSMMIHRSGPQDHFPRLAAWMKAQL